MNHIPYESAEEVKNRLHELYNSKIQELELLKTGLEEMRNDEEKRIETLISQKEAEKNSEVENIKMQIEQNAERKCAEMEALFEHRVQEAVKKIVQSYSGTIILAMDKIRTVFTDLEDSILKLVQFHNYETDIQEFKGEDEKGRGNLQEEKEFQELLLEQEERLKSIADMVNQTIG